VSIDSLKLTSQKKIPTNLIMYLKSDRNYTVVYTQNDDKYMSGLTLKVLEKRIINSSFMRINKGLLINFRYIKSFSEETKDKFVCLNNGTSLPISRRKYAEVKAYFDNLIA
jgi:DNA-binding LytR/AlgR family response regulator